MKYLTLALLCFASVAGAQTYYNKTTIAPNWPPGIVTTQGLTASGTYLLGTPNQNYLGINSTITGNVPNAVTWAPLYFNFTFTNFSKSLAPFAFGGLEIDTRFGGSGDTGGFMGLQAIAHQTAATGNLAAGINAYYVGGTLAATGAANEGGTAGDGNGNGTIFGINNFCTLGVSATYWRGCVGQEINTQVATGASVEDKVGLQIIQTSGDHTSGTLENSALVISNQTGAVGWNLGIAFGQYFSNWPMASTGTLIGCAAHFHSGSCGTTAHGIDFSNITLTSDAFKTTGFTVDGSGNLTQPLVLNLGTSLSAASWEAAGYGLSVPAATFNDTTVGSGGVTTEAAYAFGAATITNTQGTANVLGNLANVYITAPVCGSGWASCTNTYALYANGKIFTNDRFTSSGGATINGASIALNKNSSTNVTEIGDGTTSGTVTIGGGSNAVTVNATTATIGATTLALSGNVTGTANIPVNLYQWGIPVGVPPSGSFPDAAGTYVIGQAPSSSATCALSAIANGTAQIICSAATFLNTAADVGRVLTINDSGTYRYFTITTQRSATGATGTISNGSLPLTGATISGVAITGTAGQFSCTCTGFVVGMGLKLSGTYGGTGSITGYVDPTTYVVSATNGTSTFTLQSVPGTAIVTTAGTPSGITYTPQGTTSLANNKLYLSGTPTTNTSAFSVPLPLAFTSAWMRFPANAICASGSGPCASGSAAGTYYAVCASTTVCTVYQNLLSSGLPTIPVSPTAWSGGNSPGAFSQAATILTILTLPIPANSMGPNGSLNFQGFAERNTNTDTPTFSIAYGGTAAGQVAVATVIWYGMERTIRNTGTTNSQVFAPLANIPSDLTTSNNVALYGAIDSTQAQNFTVRGTLATATNYLFSLGGVVTANYAP